MIPTYSKPRIFAVLQQCSQVGACMNVGDCRGYTNNDTLPEWGIQASYLGCLAAAGVLIALTANLRARYCARRHIYTNPNANLNANLNANP
jgi:hypothetical protein